MIAHPKNNTFLFPIQKHHHSFPSFNFLGEVWDARNNSSRHSKTLSLSSSLNMNKTASKTGLRSTLNNRLNFCKNLGSQCRIHYTQSIYATLKQRSYMLHLLPQLTLVVLDTYPSSLPP